MKLSQDSVYTRFVLQISPNSNVNLANVTIDKPDKGVKSELGHQYCSAVDFASFQPEEDIVRIGEAIHVSLHVHQAL